MSEPERPSKYPGVIELGLPVPPETPKELVGEIWMLAQELRSFERLCECEQLNPDDPPDAWRYHLSGLTTRATEQINAARRLLSGREDLLSTLLPSLMVIRRHLREASEYDKLSRAFWPDAPNQLIENGYTAARSHVCRLEEVTARVAFSIGTDVGRSSWPPPNTIADRVLQVLLEGEVFEEASRLTTAQIAQKADGLGTNPDKFKWPVRQLSTRHLVSTRPHRGGGVWLTSKGRRLAETRHSKR